jgi:hypothetical protein
MDDRDANDNDGGDIARRTKEAGAPASRSLLKAVATGVIAACVCLAVLVGIGALLALAGLGSGLTQSDSARVIAISAVLALVASVAFGAWAGVRMHAPGKPVLAGGLIAGAVILAAVAVGGPFVSRIADFRSVAIALDLIDAPNVGTRPTEALHRLATQGTAGSGFEGESPMRVAQARLWKTVAYVICTVVAVVAAGVCGAVLGARRGSSQTARPVRKGAASALAVLALGMAALTVVLWQSLSGVYTALFDFDQSAGPDIGVSLSEVARHPEVMWGETVTISARVDQRLDEHTVILGNDKPIVGDRVLVVSGPELEDQVLLTQGSDAAIDEGDVVQVTGVVRPYDLNRLESRLGITLDANLLTGYRGSAVLVAEAIDVDVPIASEAGDKEFGIGSGGYDRGITIDDIAAQPEELAGLTVTVSDEVEEDLLTPHAFLLGDEGMLSISVTPRPELFVEATAYVTGEVRIFNLEEVRRITGLDLAEGFRAYNGRPVILVESLVVVA